VVSPIATAAIRFLLFTGLRLREVLGLRWDHVEIEAGRLLLPDSKTGRRYVVLGAPALAVLAGLPRFGACVFPGNDGDSPRHDLHRPWAAVTQHAGLVGVRLHDLRHRFGSVGATSGVGMTVVGKLLGHRQVSTTKRYSGVAEEALRQASTQIGNTLADALAPRAAQK
jgi:integrase